MFKTLLFSWIIFSETLSRFFSTHIICFVIISIEYEPLVSAENKNGQKLAPPPETGYKAPLSFTKPQANVKMHSFNFSKIPKYW